MTFEELMQENGYELKTTFWNDFSIADKFGVDAIKDTFNRAFQEWKSDHIYLTELVLVLNHKVWQYYKSNPQYSSVYQGLWETADNYACENLKGNELEYFLNTTD